MLLIRRLYLLFRNIALYVRVPIWGSNSAALNYAMILIIACAVSVLATPAEDAYHLGKSLLDKKEYKAAVIALDKAISLNSKCAKTYCDRGQAHRELRQDQECIGDCIRAINLDPKYAMAYAYRGAAYSDLGQYQKGSGSRESSLQ